MTSEILFDQTPEKVELTNGEIHIFCASLDPPRPQLEQFAETLSKDERQRAARFYFEKDKARFVAGRGILREILGWLLEAGPRELVFSRESRGKPQLAGPAAGGFLHFNLAHCDSLAIYAVSRAHEVGVDLERIRPIFETEEIVAHCFSDRERAQWLSLPGDSRGEAFFNCWTRKEASLKAGGQGIGGSLFNAAQFSLRSLTPAMDYTAAVAVKCRDARVNCWKWQGERPGNAGFC